MLREKGRHDTAKLRMGAFGFTDNIPSSNRFVFTPQANWRSWVSISLQFEFSEFWALLPEQREF